MSELRLTGDDPPEEERAAGGGDESKKKKRGGDEPKGARQRRRTDGELRGRLLQALDRLAEVLEGRGELELAAAIREDSRAMAGGLVSLTRPLTWLRGPIIAALAVAEPLLAFGRVARIVAGRWNDRRERIAAEAPPPEHEAESEPPTIEPWCTCGAGEFQPPEAHVYPCPGSSRALEEERAASSS